MFRKLMKYDFIAMGRFIVPCLGISLGLSVLGRIFLTILSQLNSSSQIFSSILTLLIGLCGFMVVLIIIPVFFFTIRHFYTTFSSKSGYLTFSVPTTATKHIISNLLVSVILMFASYLVMILSLLILIPNSFSFLSEVFKGIAAENALTPTVLLVLVICLFSILSAFCSQMMIYCSISIGSQFKNSRVGGSVLAYFLISMAQSFLSPFIMTLGVKILAPTLRPFLASNYISTISSASQLLYDVLNVVTQYLSIVMVFSLILFVVEFIITRYLFTKKLNLV